MVFNPLNYRIGRPIIGLIAGMAFGAAGGLVCYDMPKEVYRAITKAQFEEIVVPPEQSMMYIPNTFTGELTHISKMGFTKGAIPGGLIGLILVLIGIALIGEHYYWWTLP